MVKKTLITSLIITVIFLLSFFVWQFLLSIYEVKIETSPNGTTLNFNSELTMKTIGINSLGWELPFRKIETNVEIIEGKDLIELSKSENLIIVKTLNKEGELRIKVSPKLSLNPGQFAFKIGE